MSGQVVIYTRFSPRRNAEEAVSCATQEQLCRDWCEKRGLEVRSAHADESVSGVTELDDRDGLMAALGDLRRGDVLLVYRRDRLARDPYLAETLRRRVSSRGARIEATEGEPFGGDDDSPTARLVRGVLDLFAQFERDLTRCRTKASMLSQQRAGRRVGRFPPYGKKIDPQDQSRWVDDPLEQPAVRRIKELASSGLSYCRIARQMTEEMPALCRGKRWSPRSVEKIARRP